MKANKYSAVTPFTYFLKCKQVLIAAMVFFAFGCFAQAPQQLNNQAVLRNSSGGILSSQPVNMRFTIRENSATGNISYREIDSVVTTPGGIITVVIGAGNIVQGNLGVLTWAEGNKYLQMEMDATGGSNYVDMGTTQLISVPFAQCANTAGSLILTSDSAEITGNNTVVVTPGKACIRIVSVVPPSSATISLTNGYIPGQSIVLVGNCSGSNGVEIANGGNINIGTSGGNLTLQNGSTLMLLWNGSQWLKMAYSSNQ